MPDNAARITEGLEHFAYCLNQHTERSGYGGGFNYEDFAQSQFKLKGRGVAKGEGRFRLSAAASFRPS